MIQYIISSTTALRNFNVTKASWKSNAPTHCEIKDFFLLSLTMKLILPLSKMKFASAFALVLLTRHASKAEAGTIEVATCDDLEMAAAATAIEDTTANITASGLASLNCEIVNGDGEGEVRSFTIESHVLTLEAPNDIETLEFQNVRFNLTNSGELLVTQDAYFLASNDINPLVSLCCNSAGNL